MDMTAQDIVNALLLELVRSPSYRLTLRGDHAHPLLVERLREMARMPTGTKVGTVNVMINGRPWEVAVEMAAATSGDVVELSAHARTAA